MRAPRIWGMVRDPRASLGRRGAHGAGLRGGVQGVVGGRGGVVARQPGGTVCTGGIHRVSVWLPMRAHACPTHVGRGKGPQSLSG